MVFTTCINSKIKILHVVPQIKLLEFLSYYCIKSVSHAFNSYVPTSTNSFINKANSHAVNARIWDLECTHSEPLHFMTSDLFITHI